ncbi:hypothetical protein B7C42_08340 [Nocardia cerradoensis]|uniref:Uncharacterized protein n=1 Tax=Nocardia cerradoensis TaxID=85688 RepID=A0A231GSN7_9NOCA|nr:hypothetical protein [Nocardia cerradoensis]OXR39592.1 hypothetical protein B7C42_08340 [Nocardia cerradoensis]
MGRQARIARLRQVSGLAAPVVLTSATTLVLGVTHTALLGHHSIEALGVAALVLSASVPVTIAGARLSCGPARC